MTESVNIREIVLEILMEVTENGQYSHVILRDVLSKYQYLDKRERAFITRVTEGTLEHLIEIDYILDQFSKVRVKKMKPLIRNLLRSSVYQLKYMDSVPDRAVCSEAVKLAGKRGFSGLKGYVNGVLRNIARGLGDIIYPQEEIRALSIKYSCPEWILKLWQQTYDKETIERMLSEFQREKPVTIRCCLNHGTSEELKNRLEQEGVEAREHPYLSGAFDIEGYDHLESLESFRQGMFTVQDVSSMLVGEVADPRAGDLVIDVCAAPGGKALHMAEKIFMAEKKAVTPDETGNALECLNRDGQGHVEARDLTEYKVELIRENIGRIGLPNISAVCRDATVPDSASAGTADVVIADLPCSGLGVLGRKADLRYRVTPEGIESLVRLQRKILGCVKDYVKPGGVLIYSTCTINPAENMDNVHWFLETFPEFTLDDITGRLCVELQESVTEKGCIQLLPGIHKSDGFFIARLIRNGKKNAGQNEAPG